MVALPTWNVRPNGLAGAASRWLSKGLTLAPRFWAPFFWAIRIIHICSHLRRTSTDLLPATPQREHRFKRRQPGLLPPRNRIPGFSASHRKLHAHQVTANTPAANWNWLDPMGLTETQLRYGRKWKLASRDFSGRLSWRPEGASRMPRWPISSACFAGVHRCEYGKSGYCRH